MLGKTNAVVNVSSGSGVDVVQTGSSNIITTLVNTNIRSLKINYTGVSSYSFPKLSGNSDLEWYDTNIKHTSIVILTLTSDVKLNYLVLRQDTVMTCDSTNVFNGVGTQNANPNHIIYIYVPSNLIHDYKTATNWSTLYNNGRVDFLAITE